jgi:hypothetical protein
MANPIATEQWLQRMTRLAGVPHPPDGASEMAGQVTRGATSHRQGSGSGAAVYHV